MVVRPEITVTMGKSPEESTKTTITTSAPALVICQEFLKVLNRNEVEQPLIWYVHCYQYRQPSLAPIQHLRQRPKAWL